MSGGGSGIDYKALLDEIKRLVREAIEESKREDVLKLGEAVARVAVVLEAVLGELKKHREILEQHSKILEQHSKILEEHSKAIVRIEATLGSLSGRLGIDLERAILNIYRDILEGMGVEPGRVEKISYRDIDGRYYRKGARLELDIYIHDSGASFIEVKSLADINDVEWFQQRCEIFEKILGKKPSRRILIAINILSEALERARELGIEVIYGRELKID